MCFVWPTVFLKLIVLRFKSYLSLCHPRDCSPPGSSVHRISQGRILERDVISFSRHRGLFRAVKPFCIKKMGLQVALVMSPPAVQEM